MRIVSAEVSKSARQPVSQSVSQLCEYSQRQGATPVTYGHAYLDRA
jgi:hypothetical protein